MSAARWDGFEKWHLLFDALCRERGHAGNAALASAFCSLSGRNSRVDFEAAKKRLRAWRSGQRLPLRRNLSLLGQMLNVGGDADIERAWLELYRRAQSIRTGGTPPVDVRAAPAAAGDRRRTGTAWLTGALVLAAGLSLSFTDGSRNQVSADLPIVNFEGRVRVPIGSSVVLLGRVDRCNRPPPSWEEIVDKIPSTRLGTFSDGGVGREMSQRCPREIAVRAIRFTGTEAGSEGIRLFGSYIRLDVFAASAGGQMKDREDE